MPITASLGALSYPRVVSLSGAYESWYLQTTTDVSFTGSTFDTSNNYYISGTQPVPTYDGQFVFKFNVSTFPINQWQFNVESTVSNTNYNMNGYNVTYDDITDKVYLAGTFNRLSNSSPYYGTAWGTVTKINSDGTIPSSSDAVMAEIPGFSNYGDQITYDTQISSNGDWYTCGQTVSVGVPADAINIGYVTKYQSNSITKLGTTALNDGSGNVQFESLCQSIVLDSTGNIYAPYSMAQVGSTGGVPRIVIRKLNKTPTGGPSSTLPIIWERRLYEPSGSNRVLFSNRIRLDSAGNVYFVVQGFNSGKSYIVKYNSTGTLQWQRQITGVVFNDLFIDASDNLYITGNVGNTVTFICKYDNSGALQWQRVFDSTASTNNALKGVRINTNDSKMYIVGTASTRGYILALPDDGTIPGSGTYEFGSATLTYQSSSYIEAAGTLTEASDTSTAGVISMTTSNIDCVVTNTATSYSLTDIS